MLIVKSATGPKAKAGPGRGAAPAATGAAASARKKAPALSAEPAAGKSKLVRDSFTIPKSEYVVLEALKLRAAKLARPTKKGEVLRAGIVALNAMGDKAFLAALGAVPSLKTGRPKQVVDPGAAATDPMP